MRPLVRVAVIREQEQADGELRDDQGLCKSECVGHEAAGIPSPPVRDQRDQGREHANRDHQECEQVMHR
jgi:hypothetical protein